MQVIHMCVCVCVCVCTKDFTATSSLLAVTGHSWLYSSTKIYRLWDTRKGELWDSAKQQPGTCKKVLRRCEMLKGSKLCNITRELLSNGMRPR